MQTVVIHGGQTLLARRLAGQLVNDHEVYLIGGPPEVGLPGNVHRVNSIDDLHDQQVDVVIGLAPDGHDVDGTELGEGNEVELMALIAAVENPNCFLVLWESGFPGGDSGPTFARERAKLCAKGRAHAEQKGWTVATMVTPVVVDAQRWKWFNHSIWVRVVRSRLGQPVPSQFVALDDVATACGVVVRERRAGVYCAVPEGSLTPARRDELIEPVWWTRLPLRWRRTLLTRWAAHELGDHYFLETVNELSNEALRALGWVPELSHEEALVSVMPEGWFSRAGSKRRQELALVGFVLVILAALAAILSVSHRRKDL